MFKLFKFDWWKDEANSKAITALVGVLKVVIPAGIALGAVLFAYIGTSPDPAPAPTPPSVTNFGPAQSGSGTQINQGDGGTVIIGYTIAQHEAALARRETQLRADLEAANTAQRALIERELQTVAAEMADLQRSYADAVEELRELRLRVAEFEGDVPQDQLEAAQQALYEGDRTLADDLFAQVEAAMQDQVKQAARAAYGRGEIAENEIRWADAATHYARAARLDETFDHLLKAREFAWRSGDYAKALHYGTDLLAMARQDGDQQRLSLALNEQALTLRAQGRFAEAEVLYREALAIGRATIGDRHPIYAIRLNNLAGAVRAQGRFAEAEELYREALAIGRATIGDQHPNYAIRLNNLADAVRAQGRLAEAEGLYREALMIDRATIGDQHPAYATGLGNLAGAVRAQGRFAEAEELYREALAIDRATIGDQHPDYATGLNNLAGAVEGQGRFAEAEDLYREALTLAEKTLGSDHPKTQAIRKNLARLLARDTAD